MLTGLGRPAVRCLPAVDPVPIRSAPSTVSAHIAPCDTAASSFDETLTLEDIEVLLGRMVRLEEDTLPDSNRSD